MENKYKHSYSGMSYKEMREKSSINEIKNAHSSHYLITSSKEDELHDIIKTLKIKYDVNIPNLDTVINKFKSMNTNKIYRGQSRIYVFYVRVYLALNKPISENEYCLCFDLDHRLFHHYHLSQIRELLINASIKNKDKEFDIYKLFELPKPKK